MDTTRIRTRKSKESLKVLLIVFPVFCCLLIGRFALTRLEDLQRLFQGERAPAPPQEPTADILRRVVAAIEKFYRATSRYPRSLTDLIVRPDDLEAARWQPYLREYPTDEWGRKLIYRVPGEEGRPFDLVSMGPDGREGTRDDVRGP